MRKQIVVVLAGLTLLVGACRKNAAAVRPFTRPQARALLRPTLGNTVVGHLGLANERNQIHITGEVSGLRKKGEHGFHIHEIGDCSGSDAKTAGEHFAPLGHPHGPPGPQAMHHTGDFGNLSADQNGVAHVDVWTDLPLLTVGQHYVVGRSFIVHEGKDDLTTQPSGNAGARVACGVIEAALP